jgi:hypothetical protein
MTVSEQIDAFLRLYLLELLKKRLHPSPPNQELALIRLALDTLNLRITQLREQIMATSAENKAAIETFITEVTTVLIDVIKVGINVGMTQTDVDASLALLSDLKAKFVALDEQNPSAPPVA